MKNWNIANTVLVFVIAMIFATSVQGQDEDTPENGAAAKSLQQVIVVTGAAGEEEYKGRFAAWTQTWKEAASHTKLTVIGAEGDDDKEALRVALEELAVSESVSEVWLVLIGHGTFDGQRAKFNLRGPDISATELATWIAPLKQRVIVINGASCSSPFINALSGTDRIVVTATKDGSQYNFARFGGFLAAAINEPAIDLDKDGQTSLLEAFCAASREVQNFYEVDSRLATEHALIDDNGDERGTPAEWFDGVRAIRQPAKGLADGIVANQIFLQRRGVDASLTDGQRTLRDELEARFEAVRAGKNEMTEEQYLLAIEPVMIQLAEIYAEHGG